MLKLLQKYKMWILVVFGVFIMISFLLADVLRQLQQGLLSRQTEFTVAGAKVSQLDAQVAAIQHDGIRTVMGDAGWRRQVQLLGSGEDANSWLLLSKSAEGAGLVGSPADGNRLARELAQQQMMQAFGTRELRFTDWREKAKSIRGLNDEQLDQEIVQMANTFLGRATPPRSDLTVGAKGWASHQGTQRLIQTYAQMARVSGPRLVKEAREFGESVAVEYIFVPVNQTLALAANEPAQEVLQAHFDKFKDVEIGGGQMGMGLRQPNKISVEYVLIDREQVRASVKIDTLEVNKAAMARPADPNRSASDLRRDVERELRDKRTDQIINALETAMKGEVLRLTSGLKMVDGAMVVPQGFSKTFSLAELAKRSRERVQTELGASIPELRFMSTAGTKTQAELNREEGLRNMTLSLGRQSVSAVNDVLINVAELKTSARPIVPVQVGVPVSEPMRGPTGSVFVMVTQAEASRSPANLDEVRAKVVEDTKKIAGIEAAKVAAESVLMLAKEVSLAEALNTLKMQGYTNAVLGQRSQMSRQFAMAQSSPLASVDIRAAIMDKATLLDPTVSIGKGNVDQRTFVATAPGMLGAVLVQIVEYRPMTKKDFQSVPVVNSPRETMTLLESKPFSTKMLMERLDASGPGLRVETPKQ